MAIAYFQPLDLGLILSYQCQSTCAHCVYNCSPQWKEWITKEDLKDMFQLIGSWKHPFQVHITGGEPFLNFPFLLQAVELAASLDIPRYVETNAGWCTNQQTVHERFATLKAAGLQSILISCSPFHAASIPLERTLLAISTAIEVYGLRNVQVFQATWLDRIQFFDVKSAVPLETYLKTYGEAAAGRLFWEESDLVSGGRAGYRLGHLTQRKPAEVFQWETCRSELLHAPHSHLDLYGNILPSFCSGLSLGKWQEFTAVQARLLAGEFPPLIDCLIRKGPYGLFQLASERYGYYPLVEGYAGKCHLCVDVRRHLARSEAFLELSPAQFYNFDPL